MNILICGSRKALDTLLYEVRQFVEALRGEDYHVLVSDALGVDSQVVWACEELEIPYTCYGIAEAPRNGASSYINTMLDSYTARDDFMLLKAEYVVGFWNGYSNGTPRVFCKAKAQETPANIYVASDKGLVCVSEGVDCANCC